MPLPQRHERAGLATTDSVLHEFKKTLICIRERLKSSSLNLLPARNDLRDLLKNLDRLKSVLDANAFNNTRSAIVAVLDVVQNKILRNANSTNGGNDVRRASAEGERDIGTATGGDQREETVINDCNGGSSNKGAGKTIGSRFSIDKEVLLTLLNQGFNVNYIGQSGLLGAKVHPNTVHNFMKRNGIPSVRRQFTEISDDELKNKVRDLNRRYPNSGAAEMLSLLKSSDPPIFIQRDRCRKALSEVDPVGTARRWAQAIKRRKYSVPTPNSLWHCDTNHALIR